MIVRPQFVPVTSTCLPAIVSIVSLSQDPAQNLTTPFLGTAYQGWHGFLTGAYDCVSPTTIILKFKKYRARSVPPSVAHTGLAV